MNPIDSPDFNPSTYREPNPQTMDNIKSLADQYHAANDLPRELRRELDNALRAAKQAGHSYSQLREASGLSIATLQAIMEKGKKA
jgi:hypothetical protein